LASFLWFIDLVVGDLSFTSFIGNGFILASKAPSDYFAVYVFSGFILVGLFVQDEIFDCCREFLLLRTAFSSSFAKSIPFYYLVDVLLTYFTDIYFKDYYFTVVSFIACYLDDGFLLCLEVFLLGLIAREESCSLDLLC
jgi:hypothetical protein